MSFAETATAVPTTVDGIEVLTSAPQAQQFYSDRVSRVADANGRLGIPVLLPLNPALRGLEFFAQAGALTGPTFSVSQVLRVVLGD